MERTKSNADWAALVLRITLGAVIFPHGAQKLLGWFGGYGYSGTVQSFQSALGIPVALGTLAIVAEFFGGLGLIAGLFTRLSAFGVGVTMAVAVATVHLRNGFFMNWAGNQKGEGYEYHLLVMGIAAAVMLAGAGQYSLDAALWRWRHKREAAAPAESLA